MPRGSTQRLCVEAPLLPLRGGAREDALVSLLRLTRSGRVGMALLAASSCVLLAMGCAGSGPAGAPDPSPFHLDPFAQSHLDADDLTTRELDDGTLIGQFVIANKTEERLAFQYKWLWLDESGIALNHAKQRWKVVYLEPLEEKIIQSRTSLADAEKALIRIAALSNAKPAIQHREGSSNVAP